MKYTQLLSLLAVSSAFAFKLPFEKRQDSVGDVDDYSYLGTNPIFPIKKECNDALEKYLNPTEECFINNIDETNFDFEATCKTFNSEKCQEIYKLNIFEVPECKSSEEFSLVSIDFMLKLSEIGLKYQCTPDENGNVCPLRDIATFAAAEEENLTEEQILELFNTTVKNTCKSAKCTNAFIEYIDEITRIQKDFLDVLSKYETGDDASQIEEIGNKVKRQLIQADTELDVNEVLTKLVDYLKSDECTSEVSITKTEPKTEPVEPEIEPVKETKKPRKCIVRKSKI